MILRPNSDRKSVAALWRKESVGYNPPHLFFELMGQTPMTVREIRKLAREYAKRRAQFLADFDALLVTENSKVEVWWLVEERRWLLEQRHHLLNKRSSSVKEKEKWTLSN